MSHDDKVKKFVGQKQIATVSETDQTTSGGFKILKVEYTDKTVEHISPLLFSHIVTDKAVDLSQLRDKRVFPVVQALLVVLRDYGIKMSELPYMSSVLNQSIDFNHKQALATLLSAWMPKPNDPEDVDLVTIDRVLKNNAQ